jgi:hypothetical protein
MTRNFYGEDVLRSTFLGILIVFITATLTSEMFGEVAIISNNYLKSFIVFIGITGVVLVILSSMLAIHISHNTGGFEKEIALCKRYLLLASNILLILISFSVIYLGGVLDSPYSPLLTTTSLFLLVTSMAKGKGDYSSIFSDHIDNTFDNRLRYFPLIIVVITISFGEMLIAYGVCPQDEIYDGDVILRAKYWIFYISFLFAIKIFLSNKINNFFITCIKKIKCGMLLAIFISLFSLFIILFYYL